jgi:hypothetical protein
MKYKVIFLIISSHNESVYSEMKNLNKFIYNLFSSRSKYFFIENKPDLVEEVIEENDHIYVRGTESFIPGIYNKSIKAIEYITKKYSFDYVIRTNLSTVWHIPNLFTFLSIQPKEKFAGGFAFQGFISGTGIIMSRDVGQLVYENPNNGHISDDVAISDTIRINGINLYDITDYKWGFLIPKIDNLPSNCKYLEITENDFSDILNFRLKNSDRQTDVLYTKILIYKIYNIKVDGIQDLLSTYCPQPIIEPISESIIEPSIETVSKTVIESVSKPVLESVSKTLIESKSQLEVKSDVISVIKSNPILEPKKISSNYKRPVKIQENAPKFSRPVIENKKEVNLIIPRNINKPVYNSGPKDVVVKKVIQLRDPPVKPIKNREVKIQEVKPINTRVKI